jgi:hypothetical protein
MESVIIPAVSYFSESAGAEMAVGNIVGMGDYGGGFFTQLGQFGSALPSLSTLGTIATIGSGIMQADSQLRQSQSQEQALRLAAQQQANNAAQSDQEAKYQEAKTDLEVKQHRLEVGALKGQQRSLLADSAVALDTGDGSPLSLLTSTVAKGAYDEDILRYGGDLAAWRARTQAQQDRDSAAYKTYQADQVGGSSLLQPAGTLLATAGRVWGRKSGLSLGV